VGDAEAQRGKLREDPFGSTAIPVAQGGTRCGFKDDASATKGDAPRVSSDDDAHSSEGETLYLRQLRDTRTLSGSTALYFPQK
jgi:hypothetical protein